MHNDTIGLTTGGFTMEFFRIRFPLFLLSFLLVCSIISEAYAEPQSETVTVDGMALLSGSRSAARDSAISDALRKAVEQSVGVMLSSETLVENSALVRDGIYSKSQGYIKQYRIVKESAVGSDYLVTVMASVGVSELKNDLGALGLLHLRAGMPRVLFMIAERQGGRDTPFYWWSGNSSVTAVSESSMKEEFLNQGFNLVDVSVAGIKSGIVATVKDADVSEAMALEAGRVSGAELVIKGSARVGKAADASATPVGSYLADVSASVIRVDNGQLLASGRGQGVSRHVSQNVGENSALELAGKDLSKKLIEQVLAKWADETSGQNQTQIMVRNLKSISDLQKVKTYLSERVSGVQNIVQRSYREGLAILEIHSKSSAQEIADSVSTVDNPDIRLEITKTTAHTIEMTLGGTK